MGQVSRNAKHGNKRNFQNGEKRRHLERGVSENLPASPSPDYQDLWPEDMLEEPELSQTEDKARTELEYINIYKPRSL